VGKALGVAAASLAAWTVLALGRGRFWEAKVDDQRGAAPAVHAPKRVEVVVPARNEAATIGPAVASLVAQRYDGPLGITLVDDDSTDDTAAVARHAIDASPLRTRFGIAPGRVLRAPWTGKLNALDAGVAFVERERGRPDYWLFTDADIEHEADNLAELVAKAERDGLDIVSSMVHLHCESGWERLLVPAFIFFFAKLYPFAWSNDPRRATAAAAGGCVLLRASALERIGGLPAIADRLIDDCALAAAVKATGGATWLGLSSRATSIREYDTLEPFWTMVKRTAFTQLGRSYAATLGAALGMAVLYLAPPALTAVGISRRDARLASIAAATWALMSALYVPTLRAYGRPSRDALALPLAATFYVAMTLDSALAHARGRGGRWKGRVQSPQARAI
jgi:hopene-associated glycosyltransferase HpnB